MNRISRGFDVVRSGNLGATVSNHRRERLGGPRRLLLHPVSGRDGTSARRINALYRGMPGARQYLEVGLHAGRTFEQVQVPNRVGVDPNPQFDLGRIPKNAFVEPVPSDAFFDALPPRTNFDIVFLDGLHTFRQTYRDLINSLNCGRSGVIIIDDVVPCDDVSALSDQQQSIAERRRRGLPGDPWHGDVYKVLVCIQRHHPDLCVRTIVGSGNPQAIVWHRSEDVAAVAVDEEYLHEVDSVSFADVFVDGTPDFFRPCEETVAIDDALRAVAGRSRAAVDALFLPRAGNDRVERTRD